jgi:toxin ParE1/3/4
VARLLRSPQAIADVDDLWFHIAKDSPPAADRIVDRIRRAEDGLVEFPEMAPARDDIAPGLRPWPVGDHRILYRMDPGVVLIVRIIHGARDLTQVLSDD